MTIENNSEAMILTELDSQNNFSTNNSDFIKSPDAETHTAHKLQAVFDIPVKVQAVLGKSSMEVNQLLRLSTGSVIELDRRVGEAIDIYVNDRLVARGEVVVVDEHLGVTMTEIVKQDHS